MIGGDGRALPGCTLEEGKCHVTAGTFEGVNVIECVSDGDITITWKSGNETTLTVTAGWVNPVNCKSVTVVSGTWNVSRV